MPLQPSRRDVFGPPTRRDVNGIPQRDVTDLSSIIRHHGSYLRSLDPGYLDGRFATPSPVRGLSQSPLVGEGGDGGADDIQFWDTDRAVATRAGTITLYLTFEPIEGSLHIRWNGIDQPPTEWTWDGSHLVIFNDPTVYVGDLLTAAYAYIDGDEIEVGTYFDEVMARNPVGFWNFTNNYADDSGHGYSLNASSSNVFTSSLINTEPSGRALDLGGIAAYTYSNTPVAAIDAISGVFSVVWAGADGNVTNHGYGNIIGQVNAFDHHFRVQHDPLTSPQEIVVEWHDGTALRTHHLPLPGYAAGEAHFWGITVDSSNVSVYVDGLLISQVAKVSAPVSQAAGHYVCVGTNGLTNQRWQGQIDGVALYASALTDDDHLRLALSAGYGL